MDKFTCTVGSQAIQNNAKASETFNAFLTSRVMNANGDEFND